MKILVVGKGGREHALAWKLAASPRVREVLVAPGNAGTETEWKCRNLNAASDDIDALLAAALAEGVAFTVVGPEVALAAGIVDRFHAAGLRIFGPSQAAAEIESSKSFAKDFLVRHRIPTAAYKVFSEIEPALDYVTKRDPPIVIKFDGLAAGKGVVVAESLAEAEVSLRNMLSAAGARVVIEDFLPGEEASYIVVASGRRYLPLASTQDHKRLLTGDMGPNTGGMGAYSPAPVVTPVVDRRVRREIIEPTLAGLAAEGRPFTGFLYAGLMINDQGAPFVVEFNARLGDPETQSILMRLDSDLLDLLEAAVEGDPSSAPPRWKPQTSLGVVIAAFGYPGELRLGDAISGFDTDCGPNTKIFHAGTRRQDNTVVTDGGRVLCVCGMGDDIQGARRAAYAMTARIQGAGLQYRSDIGYRAIARSSQ